jgi:hypothetical protein
MQSIHPSLFRRQITEYVEELRIVKRAGLPGEDVCIKERLTDFQTRYLPWGGLYVDAPASIFTPRRPAVLVLEQVGQDVVLFPSDAPWQTNLFLTREEAKEFASKHYEGWEVTEPSLSVPPKVEIQIFSENFCQ